MSARALVVAVVVLLTAGVVVYGQTSAERGSPAERALDEIRTDLAELRFEKALVQIEALLADPKLTEEKRVETLILRAQAHASYGDLDAVENDYREILTRRPAYVPEATLTPPKAITRFDKVQSTLVGDIQLTVRPAEAQTFVDGREVVPSADGVVRSLAGDRLVRLEHGGFDSIEQQVTVEAGKTVPLVVQLIPNARTVVVRTEPDGVEVKLDGVPVGTTKRPHEASHEQPAAELAVEHVSLGDHVFELSKPCYRTVRIEDFVTVDLTDYSPRVYKPVNLDRAHSQLVIEGGPEGGEVEIDGERHGTLPVEPLDLCPGARWLEIVAGGRVVWRSAETLPTDGTQTVRITPRPNLVLVGTDDFPSGLEGLELGVSSLGSVPVRDPRVLVNVEDWGTIDFPDNTDLGLAVLPPAEEGAPDRWLLYSPLLRKVVRIDGDDVDTRRPRWILGSIGVNLVDSSVGGEARVAQVAERGPAASAGIVAGDRVVSIGGEAVSAAARAVRTIRSQAPGTSIELEIESVRGDLSKVTLDTAGSPRVFSGPEREDPYGVLLAAWATVDGAVGDLETRSTALANLAMLLGDAGRHRTALETWRRVRWSSEVGVGKGTVAYYTGRILEALSKEQDALEAFRTANKSAATTFADEGPEVAPAAADHLADLGVAPN